MSGSPASIAASLTKGQREALLRLPNGYFDPNIIRSLRKRGLVERAQRTPLGFAVRDCLLGKGQG